MLKLTCLVALVGCIPPASAPPPLVGPYDPQSGAAAAPPPAEDEQASGAAPASGLDCTQLFECFQGCTDGSCIQACLARADQPTQAAASAVMQCSSVTCRDGGEDCMATQCQAEMDACRGTEPVAAYTPPPVAAPPPTPAQPAAASMHVASLVKEFENNEVRAQQAFGGQRLRVYGTVNSIEVGGDGRIQLTFKSSGSTYGNARCFFGQAEAAGVATLQAHQEATVDGTVRGWQDGFGGAKVFVVLDGCTVP